MADLYGVVVEKHPSSSCIWLLFRGIDSGLTKLDEDQCSDHLRIGDIVQAKDTGTETRIRRLWPFPDSVWSDGTKLVVRTIVSYKKEITIDRGRWKDEKTDVGFVTLFSRDLGLVAAPVQWYNREFPEAGECHLFVYVEYFPRVCVNLQTAEQAEFFWNVIEDRISLPAIPGTKENPEKFMVPGELRKVPALTIQRSGNHMLAWSYALGDRVAIILDDDKSEAGQWLMVTAIPSSARDFGHHECAYTILKQETALPYSHPEIRIDKGTITMTLTLTRSDSSDPKTRVRLWHEFWGMPVGYDDSCETWIRCEENSQFRAIVEVSMARSEDEDGRRVRIRAIGPPATPRRRGNSATRALDNLDDLKQALIAEESNNNNNDEPGTDKTTIDDKPMKKGQVQIPEEKKHEFAGFNFQEKSSEDQWKEAMRAQSQKSQNETNSVPSPTAQHESPTWNDVPKKEMKSARKASENGLDWKNWGKKEEEKQTEKEEEKKGPGRGQYDGVRITSLGGFSEGGMSHPMGMHLENDVEKEKKESQKGWVDPDSVNARASMDEIIELPTRMWDDTETERLWKAEMETKGWVFPPELTRPEIPDGCDGWEPYEKAQPPVIVNRASPMPIQALLQKRNIVRDIMKLTTMQCLITRVRFDDEWKKALRIQLFILSNTPTFVVHRIEAGGHSWINDMPEFTTVGNVVDVHIGRHLDGFFVHDEMWRFVRKIDIPMREIIYEPGNVKRLQLIVTADCLSPEAQNRHNERWRWERREKGRFTLLHQLPLGNICYENDNRIDPEEHESYTYQMVVVPEEILSEHVFWNVTEVLWRIQKMSPEHARNLFLYGSIDGRPPTPPPPSTKQWPPPKFREPVEFKHSVQPANYYHRDSMIPNNIVTVPREERLEDVLALYAKFLENETLMNSLLKRTGFDYTKKFRSCIEVAQTAYPHQKSMMRELQVNADFLFSIVENAYTEQIFRECGEKRLWKLLVKTCDGIKAFRARINKR